MGLNKDYQRTEADEFQLDDDDSLDFGTDDNFQWVFNSGQSRIELVNTNTGNASLAIDVDDDNLNITNGVSIHDRNISNPLDIPSDKGVVMAGPVSGSSAVSGDGKFTVVNPSNTITTEAEVREAINTDSDHGSTAPHNYFSGDHTDLTNIQSDQHHSKTSSASELNDVSSTKYFESIIGQNQTNAEDGIQVNFADFIRENQGFTKITNSEVRVDNDGVYRINFSVSFERVGSSGSNTMFAVLRVNSVREDQRAKGIAHIQSDTNGNKADCTASTVISLSAGDKLFLIAGEEKGGETGNTIERARLNITDVSV